MKKKYVSLLFLIVFGFSINFAFAQKPTVSIRVISKYPLIEGNQFQFKIGLSAASTEATVIDIATLTDSADESDYTPLLTTITIPAGALFSNDFSLNTTNDSNIESTEVFSIKATVKSNNTFNNDVMSAVYITDNDTTPTLKTYVTNLKVVEGKSYNYSFYLTNPYRENIVVNFTTADGTADGSDYTSISKTITIPKGETSTYFSIATTTDTTIESDETFTIIGTVTSGNTTNTTITSSITIIDDDTLPTLIINSNQGYEGQSAYNSIILSRPYHSNVVVQLSTSNGTADATDFTSVNNVTRTILAGNTSADYLQISLTDDLIDEPIENFTLTGTVTSGNTTNTTATSTVEIIDNDGLPDLIINTVNSVGESSNIDWVEEGQKTRINLRLSQASETPTIVQLATSNGSADESDYTPLIKTIIIPAGTTYFNTELIEISTTLDTTQEPTETFTVTGTVTSGNTFNASTSKMISIYDNYSINAQNDSPISYYKVGATFNLLENDTNQGIAINANDVIVTLSPNSEGITINSEGIITIPATLPMGYYTLNYSICEKTNANNCDTASITLNVSSPLEATYTSTYSDYNGDGYTSAGDIITYQFKITNKGNATITNITYDITPNTNQKDLKLYGELITSLNPDESDDSTFSATKIITQNDINFGNNWNEPGTGGGFFQAYVAFKGTYYGSKVTGMAKATDTFIFKKSDGIKLNAFIDSNANGKQDTGEILFPKGKFNYEINNDGKTHILYSNPFYLYESNPTTKYHLTYQINEEYSANFTCNTSYTDVTVTQDSGITTYNFPIIEKPYVDLAVNIHNGAPPRPGFKYYNTISYTNNSSKTVVSGTITFTKDETVSILEISEPSAIVNATGFTFNFSNLLPFQTRTIWVAMQVPTIPTVSLGQTLTNTSAINIPVDDIHPENNNASLTQTIVGSYDPNDKTESHGEKITYTRFDENEYLKYTIRFENTGTASAINIRVNDVLDAKLDANTVRMVDASHEYVLERIENDLTWNFFGIDLPPSKKDDEITGHGYIVFKVKPKAGFSVGDIIPNTANIYFDFNPAIVTNTWTTEFVPLLAVNQIENSDYIFYPNPVTNTFTISLKNNSESIDAISILDILGKTVLSKTVNNSKVEVDVSNLSKGVYFAKVKTNESENTIKIIKD